MNQAADAVIPLPFFMPAHDALSYGGFARKFYQKISKVTAASAALALLIAKARRKMHDESSKNASLISRLACILNPNADYPAKISAHAGLIIPKTNNAAGHDSNCKFGALTDLQLMKFLKTRKSLCNIAKYCAPLL